MTIDQADPGTRKGRQEVLLSGYGWGGKGKGKERLGKWRPQLRNRVGSHMAESVVSRQRGCWIESKEPDGQRVFKADLGSPAYYIGIRL